MSKELQPGTTGKRGRRGNEIFWTHPSKAGIIISRAASDKIIKLNEERKPHAAAFGGANRLCQSMIKAIRLGFPKNAAGNKGANLFVQANLKNGAIEGIQNDPDTPVSKDKKASEEFHAVVHFDRLLVGQGILEEPSVTMTIDEETHLIMFTQENTIVEGAMNEVNDRIYVVVYETVAKACIVQQLRKRGESGSTPLTLPSKYKPDNLAIYTFATNRQRNAASNSLCLKSPTSSEE